MEQYIPKAALVAEIERIKNTEYDGNSISDDVACCALDMVIETINSLEVKEVDFEMELKEFLRQYYNYDYPKQYQDGTGSNTMPHIVETAKYFFNLGLKAQKGK